MAASRGHNAMPEVVAALIEAGADRTAVDELGCAPLHQAVLTKCEGSFLALVRGERVHMALRMSSTFAKATK